MPETNATQSDTWTIQRLLTWTRTHFTNREVDEPRLSAEILLAKALGCKRIELYAWFDRVPEASQLDTFRDYVKRAANHEPISYLVGSKEFYSLEFEVTPAVLIPRPETEVVVQQTIETVRAAGKPDAVLLDWCTGSGCIAVSLLSNLPEVRIVATDISDEALAVAGRNAARHNVSDRLALVQADRLNLPSDCVPEGGFDFIVANPPYVPAHEVPELKSNVRDHEPGIALTDGEDGFTFYRLLAAEGQPFLKQGGCVLVEIADDGAEIVHKAFTDGGDWVADGVWRDTVVGGERAMRFRPNHVMPA
ncbi:MAG: peptide chain release factor N(5)-glutamine methyltransferase [Phycisphaerales bacterium]|nr:peptide chain release factor N(5)-glutamine methyltransferase [Phycisphaerales bacterium]